MESYKIGMSYPNKRVMNNSGGQVPVTKTGKNPSQSTEEGVTPLLRDVPGSTLGPLLAFCTFTHENTSPAEQPY